MIPTEIQDKILMMLKPEDLKKIKDEDDKSEIKTISDWVRTNTAYDRMWDAIAYGTLTNIEWLYNYNDNDNDMNDYVPRVAMRGDISVLEWMDNKCKWPDDICQHAVISGSILVVEWFMAKHYKLEVSAINRAVYNNDKNMTLFLIKNGCLWNNLTFIRAIDSGSMEYLEYLHNLHYEKYNTYEISPDVMSNFKEITDSYTVKSNIMHSGNNIGFMTWFHKYMIPFNEHDFEQTLEHCGDTCRGCEIDDIYSCLKWYLDNGFTFDENSIINVFRDRYEEYIPDLDISIWLMNHGCPCTIEILNEIFCKFPHHQYNNIYERYKNHNDRNKFNMAVYMGDLIDMKCLYLLGETFDDETLALTNNYDDQDIIDWLEYIGCSN